MGLEFTYPWALVLFPAAIAWVLWIDRRYRRRQRSLKSRVALGTRLILTTLLALAITAPSVLIPGDKNATWVLVDVSDSAATVQSAMEQRLSAALASIPKDEQVGIIAFGADAMVEVPLSETPSFSGVHTAVNPSASDLEEALRLAGALLPSESTGRVVVLSDGQVSGGKAAGMALMARGVTVDGVQWPVESLADAQVTEVKLPQEVFEGQKFSIEVTVDSQLDTEGTLVLYQNGTPTATRDIQLRKGENRFAFQDTTEKTGVVTYEARLVAKGDTQSRNNSASGYLYASGTPTVLLVEGTYGGGSEMHKMLAAAGMNVETTLPEQLPLSAESLRQYDSIVLANVDVDAASQEQWQALEQAVRTLGRGLCVLGGDSSYALGGYRGSTLETLLPVTIDVRNKLRMPALSLMLVIDKSGSMTEGQFGTTRLEVAKEAAMSATEILTQRDQVGVIAFDDAAKWVVPLQEVTDVGAIQELIGTIRPGGGTAFYSAMDQGISALIAAQTPQKHMIFLSDGEPGDSGFEKLLMLASQNGITVTTVAVGSGANTRLMELISTLGGGRAYAAGEFDNIPKIFTKETFLAGGSYVQNRVFTPVITESSTLTNFDGFPSLAGYLTTTEKPLATVSLVSDEEDPILAWWPYGAGTVAAWTSDTQGAWTESFLRWENAAAFFGGIVAKTLPQNTKDGVLEVETENGTAKVRYTAPSGENGGAEGGLSARSVILRPDGTEEILPLTEVSAGVYEGSFAAETQGAYALRVEQLDGNNTLRTREGGAVVSFSEEYDLRRQSQRDTLAQIVAATGGRMLSQEDPLITPHGEGARQRRQLTTALCILAMIVLLVDIALRRLSWEAAVVKWLGMQAEKKEQAASQPKPERAQKPAKPKKGGNAAPTAVDTANKLLEAKKQRKQL